MAQCWEQVLSRDVAMSTPFGAYGGNSLTAMQLRTQVKAVFGKQAPIQCLTLDECAVRGLLLQLKSISAADDHIEESNRGVQFPLRLSITWIDLDPHSFTRATLFKVAIAHR
jgi:hypothetical protein